MPLINGCQEGKGTPRLTSMLDAVALTQYSLLLMVNLLLSNKSSPVGSSNKCPNLHG